MSLPWIAVKKKVKITKTDLIIEQVRGILQKEDQKLILMVRQ